MLRRRHYAARPIPTLNPAGQRIADRRGTPVRPKLWMAVPVLWGALARVGVFVEVGAIELAQSVGIGREVRAPVDQHAEAISWQAATKRKAPAGP